MNNDATEAALGLLGLSPRNALPPPPPPSPLIPLKRKQSSLSVAEERTGINGYEDGHDTDADTVTNPEGINCICGSGYDDGFSIACDDCSRWCHAACFDIVQGEVPDEWRCWICKPREVNREKAARLQRARQQAQEQQAAVARKVSPGTEKKGRQRTSANASEGGKRRRRSSVNTHHPHTPHTPQPPAHMEDEHVDIDEPWTHSYVPISQDIVPRQETRDKLRRQAQHWRGITALQSSQHISPVHLPEDAHPAPTALHQLPDSAFSHPTLSLNTNASVRPPSYAMHTTAPVPSAHLITPYTSVITPSSTYLADPLNSYAHLGMPKPFVHLMGPPLDLTLDARISGDNGRFVRSGCKPNAVLRPVLCKPDPTKKQYHSPEDPDLTFGVFALRDLKANEEVVLGWEWDDGHAVHALPALIEQPTAFPLAPLTSCPPSMFSHSPSLLNHLRNQMTSILHALSSTFTTCACGSSARDCALAQMAAFVDGQLPDAPEVKPDLGPLIGVERGFRTRERVPSGGMSGMEMDYPTPGPSRSAVEDVADAFRASNSQLSGRLSTPERGKTLSVPALTLSPATASPSPKKDRKGKRRAWGERPAEDAVSMDMWTNEDGDDAMRLDTSLGGGRRKHTKLAVIIDSSPTGSPRHPRHHTPDAMHVDEEDQSPRSRGDLHGLHPEREMSMPLKMRKRWLRQTKDEIGTAVSNASPSTTGGAPHGPGVVGDRVSIPETERMDVDMQPPNPSDMPPPPMPAYLDPTTVKSTSRSPAPDVQVSPSTSFANLSLQSPVVRGPSPRSRSSYSPPRESMPSRLFLPTPEPSVEPLPRIDTSRLPPIDNFSPDPSTLLPSPLAPRARSDSPEELRHLPSLKRDDPTFRSPQSATPPPESSHSSTNADIMPEDNGISYRAISLDRSQEPISSDPNSEHGRSSNHEPVPEPVTEPAPPRVPTPPPPPPKVKLSLKDFALRKKKQREEEIAKAVSPSTATHDDESVPTTPQLNGGSIPALDALSNGHDVKTDSPTVDAAQTRNGDTTMAPDSIPTVELVAFKSHEAEAEAETDKARVENKETSVAPASPRRAASLNDPPVKMTICDSTPASVDESNADAKLTGPTSPLPSNGNGNGVTPSDPHPPPASLQAKIEVLDEPIPNGLVAAAEHTSRGRAFSPELPPPLDFAKARRPSAPSPNPSISDRRPSREDGEILPSPPPSKPLSFAPRSHTPPTQPRSFQISPGPLSTPSPRRSSLPYTNPAARPLPSGPRALRGVNAMGHSTSLYPPSRPAYSGSQFIPRGPSADRDRGEWDRERGPWSARGRGGRGGWR